MLRWYLANSNFKLVPLDSLKYIYKNIIELIGACNHLSSYEIHVKLSISCEYFSAELVI